MKRYIDKLTNKFQHTAARRRLPNPNTFTSDSQVVSTHSRADAAANANNTPCCLFYVSTHSRAEAAASAQNQALTPRGCFNTQPRGGGCQLERHRAHFRQQSFNTQPRGGGCQTNPTFTYGSRGFNTQPRGGGCVYKSFN